MKNIMYNHLRSIRCLLTTLLIITGVAGCSVDNTSNPISSVLDPVSSISIDHAIDVQNRHTDELMSFPGVVGTGTGLDGTMPVMYIFTSEHNVEGIPSQVEDVRTHIEFTGTITPQV